MSKMLSWIASKAKGMTRYHLEGIAVAVVASTAIFYVAELYKKRTKDKLIRHYSRSQSLGALHGGKVAMQRILDAQHARVDPSVLDGAEKELKELLSQETLHFSKLQSVVAKLEMSGKEDAALKTLIAEKEQAEKNGRCHEAYELDMLIVEMFIYKGNLKDALSRKCLEDTQISDARRPLYKTIIRLMQGERRLAEESWKEFRRIKRHFQGESTHSDEIIHDHFEKFETRVQFLKKEIDAVHHGEKMKMIKETESL